MFDVRLGLFLLLSCFAFACAAPAAEADDVGAEADSSEAAQTANGRVGVHGMVLFGGKTRAWLSHIPMFQSPHDVQMIVEIELPAFGANMPPSFSDRLYTFVPERMSLDALRTGALASLRGTIYLGSFEEGGRPIARNVVVKVTRIVHQHVLSASAPAATKHLLVGTPAEAFDVRVIGGAHPAADEGGASSRSDQGAVDRIAAVKLGARRPTDAALASGAMVELADVDITSTHELSCLTGPDFVAACR